MYLKSGNNYYITHLLLFVKYLKSYNPSLHGRVRKMFLLFVWCYTSKASETNMNTYISKNLERVLNKILLLKDFSYLWWASKLAFSSAVKGN